MASKGWKIPKYFHTGETRGWRVERGVKALWAGLTIERRAKRIEKRGRRGKSDRLSDQAFLAQKPTLAQMQAFVIKLRARASNFLASGWLASIAALGGSPKGKVDPDRGGVMIQRGNGLMRVTLWNRTPGIVTVNRKKNFVGKAIAARLASMSQYIAEKRAQALAILKK